MKKIILSTALISALATGSSSFAYELKVVNDSQTDITIRADGLSNKIVKAGTTDIRTDINTDRNAELTYVSDAGHPQTFASLHRPTDSYGVAATYFQPNDQLQDLKISINGGEGSYTSFSPGNPTGICAEDGEGVWCPTGTMDSSTLTLTISGGHAAKPVEDYTYNAGEWNIDTVYQPQGTPIKYPLVSYNNSFYVACWWTQGEIPDQSGTSGPWKPYNPDVNVCMV